MEYIEFEKYKKVKDPQYPLYNAYENEAGDVFYIEPMFYQAMQAYKDKMTGSYEKIIASIEQIIRENHKVIFVSDFEYPAIRKEGFIYRELQDITDLLHITWVDDSRPSDYGD